jgi:hypothetical protein
MKRSNRSLRVVIALVLSAATLLLWVRSHWATDTLTYHGQSPSSLSVSANRGVLRLERSMLTTASDRTLRFWHGRDPIEADPRGEGVAGFHHYRADSGSWTTSVPLWLVAALFGLYALSRARRRRRMLDSVAAPAVDHGAADAAKLA